MGGWKRAERGAKLEVWRGRKNHFTSVGTASKGLKVKIKQKRRVPSSTRSTSSPTDNCGGGGAARFSDEWY